MKQLSFKFLSSLLMAVGALCMSFITAKAQSGVTFLTPELQYVSDATFDQSGNPTDSTVYVYTEKGYPFGKEAYIWDSYSGERMLSSTVQIAVDKGNDFTVDMSLYDENALYELTEIVYNCNDAGELQKMVSTSLLQTPGLSSVTTMQYWRTGNRLDSTLSTTTMAAYNLTSTIKTKYKAYDADGRPTLEEIYFSSLMGSIPLGSDTHSVLTFTYSKNGSGNLTSEEVETDQYNSAGALESVTKNVTSFDAKERPIRTDEYFGPTLAKALAVGIDSYTIYHYTTNTDIANLALPVKPIIANVADGSLSINSAKAERIEIYSISGMLVYTTAKPAGEIEIPIEHFPQGIYIVKGSSGWVKKIVYKL